MKSSQSKPVPNEEIHQKESNIEMIDFYLRYFGVPATVDQTIEGGVILVQINPELMEALQTYGKASIAYQAADGGSSSWVDSDLKNYPWKPPTIANLEVIIVNHGKNNHAERDRLVDVMDKAGYRPPTLAEKMALAITRPGLNKRAENFHTYEKFTARGIVRSLCFVWDGSDRYLGANDVSVIFYGQCLFLFVPK